MVWLTSASCDKKRFVHVFPMKNSLIIIFLAIFCSIIIRCHYTLFSRFSSYDQHNSILSIHHGPAVIPPAPAPSEDVMCGQTIFDVKQLIEGKWGIPPSCQRLLRDAWRCKRAMESERDMIHMKTMRSVIFHHGNLDVQSDLKWDFNHQEMDLSMTHGN